jgi:outer membrane protein TolC
MAAGENLEILVDAESRSEKTFRLIKRLVDGGEREPALIHQANAELLRKKAEVRRAELVLFQARQALAVDMGYNPVELPNAPLAEGSFPRPRDDETMPAEQSRKLIEEALVRRGDYLAAQSNVDTELILLHRSENALKPRVDFNIRVGYAEFNADSTFSDEDGLNAVAGVSVDWPIANNRARGNLEERRTWRRRAELTQAELASGVASEVLVAEASLINAREEHKIAVEAVDAYRKAVVDINRKITLGEASLIDLTEMEERYAQARTAKVNSVRKYAVAIAELQFVTGRLLSREGDDGGWKIDMRLLSQLNSSE